MNRRNPIKNYMTHSPRTIGEDLPLSKAKEIMNEFHIRHLPVQSRGRLVGVLSERDVSLALSVHPSATDMKVSEVMTEEPYAVTPECSLEQAAREMAKNKYGCAVVENDQGRAIGIFTAVDALAVLAEMLSVDETPRHPIKLIS